MNKDIIKKIIVAILVISLFFSFVVSLDFHHLDSCHEENCHKCSFIHYVQNILKSFFIILIYLNMVFFVDFCLSQLHRKIQIFMQKSLVFQKVQFNE